MYRYGLLADATWLSSTFADWHDIQKHKYKVCVYVASGNILPAVEQIFAELCQQEMQNKDFFVIQTTVLTLNTDRPSILTKPDLKFEKKKFDLTPADVCKTAG